MVFDFVTLAARPRAVLYALAAMLSTSSIVMLSRTNPPEALYVPDRPLSVYHIVGENSSQALKAVYRTYLEGFVKSGAPASHPDIPWKWTEVDSGYFFNEMLEAGPLEAGSVVVIDNAAVLKSEEDAVDTVEIAVNPILRGLRLWQLLNNSEPIVVFLHNDGQCDTPWPKTTHHMLYRDTWCERFDEDWRASQAAERERGPKAGWVRSAPFGTGFNGGALAELSAERRPLGERRLLLNYRGTRAYRKPSRELLYESAQTHAAALGALADRVVGHLPAHPSGVDRVVVELRRVPLVRSCMKLTESENFGWCNATTAAEGGEEGEEGEEGEGGARGGGGGGAPGTSAAALGSTAAVSHVELLRDSLFTLCPPGDQWEDYRVYEAMEAGSIPVVVRNATYKRCTRPHAHLEGTLGALRLNGAELPGVIMLDSWDELPSALNAATADMARLAARQQAMLAWLAAQKRRLFSGLHGVVRLMRARRWKAETTCSYMPLHWSEVAQQHQGLAHYWRTPQPRIDDAWNATPFWAYQTGLCVPSDEGYCEDVLAGEEHLHPMGFRGNEDLGGIGRCFKGPGCWCESTTENWRERCLTTGCGLNLAHKFWCELATHKTPVPPATIDIPPDYATADPETPPT